MSTGGSASGGAGPPLYRPIPHRPFDLNVSGLTPPEKDSPPPSPGFNASLLSTTAAGASPEETVSRAASMLNLTASTLFGIYSPATSARGFEAYHDRDEPGTPWGTGAETPAKRPSVDGEGDDGGDNGSYKLGRDRSALLRMRSTQTTASFRPRPNSAGVMVALALRATLLFGLGLGYGVLVSRLQDGPGLATLQMDGIVGRDYDWAALVFWGISGVILGILLPWFDGVWDGASGATAAKEANAAETDWPVVMRSIGAFAGIVFAIRKLPWASTMQVSLTLGLVNPFLWWLIDRSVSGFLLSSAVGLAGSALLMGISPGMVPAPAHTLGQYGNASSGTGDAGHLVLGGLARQDTVETAIWVLSVLFCSCLCFGNIGRRLALGASARGRWGHLG